MVEFRSREVDKVADIRCVVQVDLRDGGGT